MRIIDRNDLIIPEERQRRDFPEAHIAELMDSFQRVGLLNPIVVRDGDTLVTGECRTRAMDLLALMGVSVFCNGEIIAPGKLPVTDMQELDEIGYMEAELDENLCRLDLSFQEKAVAIAKLSELRTRQNGGVVNRVATAQELVTRGLVESVGGASALLTQSVLIANNLSNPAVAKAKNANEAMKIIRRQEDAKRNELLALDVGTKSESELYQVYNADCIEWLRAADPKQFDCILIDPPYGMGADQFGDAAGKLSGIDHKYDDSKESFTTLMRDVMPLLKEVGKDEHHLYVFCDIDNFHWLRALAQDCGYWVFRTPLINIKREGGRVPWPENGPRRCYEICLYAVAGKKAITGIYRDIFESTLETTNIGHGAQKPVEAYVDLLKRSTKPGDKVLDCFAGSGTIIEAARQLKLKAVAVEREAQYYGLCLQRLNKPTVE